MRRFAAGLLLLAAACSGGRRPDVLLVTVDTLRADHTSAFGYELPTTPALERLAARGTAFLRCLSQHPETDPSISTIMTSRHPRETGVRENGAFLPPAFPVLAERFRKEGYRTAAFVSTYLLKPHACGLHRGFDTYDHEMTSANLGHERFERRAEETVDRAVRWLAGRASPWFLWVHLYDPHGKYDPGPALARRFYRDRGRPDLDPSRIVPYQRTGDSLDPDDYTARYDGEIFRADRALGRLLKAAGRGALVAFTADHGEGLGEHDYWFRHGSLLDRAALHVPLVFAGPGVPAGRRVPSLVRNLDVAPTLLDLAGLPPLPGARGRSLVPEMGGTARGEPPPAFAEARRRGGVRDRTGVDTRYKAAVTTPRYRLLLWPETGEARLHDLEADPGEERDVSAARPGVAARLRALLEGFLALGDAVAPPRRAEDVSRALRGLGYLR